MAGKITAKDACKKANASHRANGINLPKYLILSHDEEKIEDYLKIQIYEANKRGDCYLPLYVYGPHAKKAFRKVSEKLKTNCGYNVKSVEWRDGTTIVNVSWKHPHSSKNEGIPEDVILSKSRDKIKEYVYAQIKQVAENGEYYLPLYVYGVESISAFKSVMQVMKQDDKFSFVVDASDSETMPVTITWKGVDTKEYTPVIKNW